MQVEWWWEAHGVLLRKFGSKDEAEAMLLMEQNPVVFITTQGWDIQVNKSEIAVVSRERKNLIF